MSSEETGRVRVYLCECGPILGKAIDLDELALRASEVPAVSGVERYATLCSDAGREWLAERMRAFPGERPVIAGCSPREHADTFAAVCREAGLNPYLLGRANLREQCAWVTEDRAQATSKAEALIRAAVARVRLQAPLEDVSIECNADALVIGAGVAGMTAALSLAEGGRQVTLVERQPAIGGRIVLLGEVFPQMECASCMLEPLMDEVLHHPRIEVLTMSEVVEVLGYFGRFTVRVRREARHVDIDACLGCGTCGEACPVSVPDVEYDAGLRERKAAGIPYAGALPNASMVREADCVRATGGDCRACADACPFGAIDLEARGEVLEREVGAIVVATGMEPEFSATADGPFSSPRVLTTWEFERMLNTDGPTNGEPWLPGSQAPRKVALVHCADASGCSPAEECSQVCCMQLAKFAHEIASKLPETEIVDVVFERTAAGAGYRRFAEESAARTRQVRLAAGDTARVIGGADGALVEVVRSGIPEDIVADLAIVAAPLAGAAGADGLAATLGVETDARGFFIAEHDRLRPYASRTAGIVLAGTAQGPKDVAQSVAHAAAAAGSVLGRLEPGGTLTHEPTTAEVDPERCGRCRRCVPLCPYKAISYDEDAGAATVNELLCHGCGTCAAACPSSAITARHFADDQILAEIRGLWEPQKHV